MYDRETVIKGCENWINNHEGENFLLTYSSVVELLNVLKEPGWISINDRLPNCNGCYLVWRPRFYIDKGMPSICYFDGQNTWHDSYGVDFTRILKPEDVSHWKPLPEQP